MTDYAALVAEGIKFLDGQGPKGWRDKIDLETLSLGSCEVCVLGQLFGDYSQGLDILGLASGHEYGFDTTGSYSALTEAWKDALGKNNVLVEVGDIYSDRSRCCVRKVVATSIIDNITAYVVVGGDLGAGNAFRAYEPVKDNLEVLVKSSFEEGGAYSHKVEAFKFKAGMFVTNDTGKVYYVTGDGPTGRAREIKDQSYSLFNAEISKKGLREVTLPNGKKLSDTVK